MSEDFDPATFMNETVDAPLATEFTMVPVGEYLAAIDDFDKDAFEQIDFTYKKGPRAGTPGSMTKFTIPFVINDENVKKELEREKVTIGRQLILEFDENSKKLATGKNKNVELGRIREAVGQQDDPQWNIMKLRGAGPVMIRVVHVDFERKDGSKGKRAEIDRVVRVR